MTDQQIILRDSRLSYVAARIEEHAQAADRFRAAAASAETEVERIRAGVHLTTQENWVAYYTAELARGLAQHRRAAQ